MTKHILLLVIGVLLSACQSVPYEQKVSNWKSPTDVAKWLNTNFSFDKDRQRTVIKRLREMGPDGLLYKNPKELYSSGYGYCVDSANFAREQLNRIDPSYNARWVFVENARGRPNHWVTAYHYQGKLYVMDYGAGPHWSAMKGNHGPYNSLDDYRKYLASLSMQGFEVGDVYYRNMPGQED